MPAVQRIQAQKEPEIEEPILLRSTRINVVKTTKTGFEIEEPRSNDLLSRVDILIQEVEDLILAVRDTNNPEKNLSGLRSIINEELEKALSRNNERIVEAKMTLDDIINEETKLEEMINFTIPELPKMNLSISPEIQELISKDSDYKFILYNIIRITAKLLMESAKEFNIDIQLKGDHENPKLKLSDINVKLNADDYNNVLLLWEKVCTEVGHFFDECRKKSNTTECLNRIDMLSDLFNITFADGEQ